MNTQDEPKDELEVSQQLELDNICMRFERQLQAGDGPSIEDYLRDSPEALRASLLEQLLLLELEKLSAGDNTPNVQDYVDRFSTDEALIRKTFVKHSDRDDGEAPLIGKTVAHYRLIRKLGAGGMGEVYLAEDTRLQRQVALKFLSAEFGRDTDLYRRFLAEARAASALNHPNVCVIYDVGDTKEDRPYIAMEFLKGQTLDGVIEKAPPEIADVVEMAAQVADALAVAHAEGIIHRDIKPANIHINESGQVKVLDFGLAKRVEATGDATTSLSLKTHSGTILGTPMFMSPEQALGKPIDHRSDIFSLGVVIYQLVTGQLPFAGTGFGEVVNKIVHAQPQALARFNYDVPAELERITRKCLEKQADRRYQSARELRVDLASLRRDLGGDDSRSETGMSVARTSVPTSSTPPPIPAELVESDVFISYAPVDDRPLTAEKQGWISQFHRNLEVRIEQLSGERVKIWRHPDPSDSVLQDEGLLSKLPKVKTMVSVLSPPFVKSEGCCKQIESFWQAAHSGDQVLTSSSRIFKVVKRPVPAEAIPDSLSDVLGQLLDFEFFEVDPATGRVREFDDTYGQAAVQRYHERIYDLAQAITDSLRALKEGDQISGDFFAKSGKTVYVATTTSDLQPDRDRICRELSARGYEVLPDRPLPLVDSDLIAAVNKYLEQADSSVHAVGSMYGVVPEGSESSILELQNQLAADWVKISGLERVIWIPRELEIRDPRQQRWIETLKKDPNAHLGAEIIQDSLEGLKSVLLDKLSPKMKSSVRKVQAGAPARIYLICDRGDVEAVEALEDYFFDQGLEVSLPDFDADESEAAEIHRQYLKDCDGVVIYYGSARHSWVDIKLRGLLKAAGYGRTRELAARAVYIAPPFDRRKERFRTHTAEVIRQEGDFAAELVAPLVEQLKQARENGND